MTLMRIRTACLVMFSFAAVLVAMTGSASASLPSVLLLPGETGLVLSGELAGTATEATFNSSLVTMQAESVSAKFEVPTEMTSLGALTVTFNSVEIKGGTIKCDTAGDAFGTALLNNLEWHTVLIVVGKLFGLGALILVPETLIECENGIKARIRGSILAKLSPFGRETQEATIEVQCEGTSNRTPVWSEYENDTGGTSTAGLGINVGLGYQGACELVEGALSLKTASMGGEVMLP